MPNAPRAARSRDQNESLSAPRTIKRRGWEDQTLKSELRGEGCTSEGQHHQGTLIDGKRCARMGSALSILGCWKKNQSIQAQYKLQRNITDIL